MRRLGNIVGYVVAAIIATLVVVIVVGLLAWMAVNIWGAVL